MPNSALPAVADLQRNLHPFFGNDGECCAHLFAAVIIQAFREIFIPQSSHDADREFSRYESIRLLTADYGEWAAHRNWLCTCANINGDALAYAVREMLSGRASTSLDVGQRREDDAGTLLFKQDQIDKARAVYSEMMRPKCVAASVSNKLPRIRKPVEPAHVAIEPVAAKTKEPVSKFPRWKCASISTDEWIDNMRTS